VRRRHPCRREGRPQSGRRGGDRSGWRALARGRPRYRRRTPGDQHRKSDHLARNGRL